LRAPKNFRCSSPALTHLFCDLITIRIYINFSRLSRLPPLDTQNDTALCLLQQSRRPWSPVQTVARRARSRNTCARAKAKRNRVRAPPPVPQATRLPTRSPARTAESCAGPLPKTPTLRLVCTLAISQILFLFSLISLKSGFRFHLLEGSYGAVFVAILRLSTFEFM